MSITRTFSTGNRRRSSGSRKRDSISGLEEDMSITQCYSSVRLGDIEDEGTGKSARGSAEQGSHY